MNHYNISTLSVSIIFIIATAIITAIDTTAQTTTISSPSQNHNTSSSSYTNDSVIGIYQTLTPYIPFACKDNTNFLLYKSHEGGTCNYIGQFNKESRRVKHCKNKLVQNACRLTCGRCCEDDPNFTFIKPWNGHVLNCESISSTRSSMNKKFCWKIVDMRSEIGSENIDDLSNLHNVSNMDGKLVYQYCPSACEKCRAFPYVSSEPTESISAVQPTIPIQSTTSIPSNRPTIRDRQDPSWATSITTERPSQESSSSSTTASTTNGISNHNTRPNILIILADDVGTGDIPSYWNTSRVSMPNLKRLAEKGITFQNAHSTPLCAPSRYMLLSGNYPHRGSSVTGTWHIADGGNQFLSRQISIAQVLKDQADYNTFMAGKYHLGGRIPLKGGDKTYNRTHVLTANNHDWSKPLMDGAQDIGFIKSYITTGGIQNHPYAFFNDGHLTVHPRNAVYWKKGNSYNMPMGISEIEKAGEGDASWDSSAYNQILVNKTSQFIDNHLYERPNDPMFMYVALGSVHTPHTPPYKYMNSQTIAGKHPTKHMDVLKEMDLAIGSLVSMIEDRGLASNTMIIFTSDNGGLGTAASGNSTGYNHFPSGILRGSKGNVYEGGHRVPLIIRWDSVAPQDEKRKYLVGLNDIYATICNITKVNIPGDAAQDSISFANYMINRNDIEALRKRQSAWRIDRKKNRGSESHQSNKWKVIQHRIKKSDGTFTSKVELYNLEYDIREQNDLSEDKSLKWRIERMLKELRQDGPCPMDYDNTFTLSEGPKRGERESCRFFISRKERCKEYPNDGESYCPSVCGRFRHVCAKTGYYWLDKYVISN